MVEKVRIFMCQLVTSALFIIFAVWVAFNIIVNTDLNNRLSSIGLNYESFESVAVGLLLAYLSVLSMMFVTSLMRRPKINYAKKKKKKTAKVKKIDMGTLEKIPESIKQ